MTITQSAAAGTLESSDALVTLSPGESGIDIEVQSIVLAQFGRAIETAVRETLSGLGVTSARVQVTDRGALDCVLRARVETAVLRACGEEG